jgi:gliding motility-associated-like protein
LISGIFPIFDVMKTPCIGIIIGFLLWWANSAPAQQYFKLLKKSGSPYDKKIARFDNGDVLIAGSPLTGATSDQNGGLNLARLDPCGKLRWASNYQWKKNYMKFKDVKIDVKNDIYVYGSAYEGSDEFIFLLKLTEKGNVRAFRIYHGGAVDNFTYNIQIKNNQVLAYGLILDWNTPKRGFMALFDERLNLQAGRVFEPFESVGEAIFTEDGGYLGRSGFYLVKLNGQLNLQWSTEMQAQDGSGLYPVAGPAAVPGGYILQASYDESAFFYKVNERGELLWKTPLFPATNQAADFSLLKDGTILATYNCPGEGENFPCQLRLSPDGTILNQQKLLVTVPLRTAAIHQSVGENGLVNVVGSKALQGNESNIPPGFVLQYELDSSKGKCFAWESFSDIAINTSDINIIPLDLTFFNLRFRNVEAGITAGKADFAFLESCDALANDTIRLDSTLTCGVNWEVTLPDMTFRWEDETPQRTRTLERPGVYRASNRDCIQPLTYEYNVKRIPCECNVYLPTAFSPNNDGQNDRLELFSNCTIQEVKMSIYNRWGNIIFENTAPDAAWNGIVQQKPAEPGIYLAVVRYRLANDTEEVQRGSIVQPITLVK